MAFRGALPQVEERPSFATELARGLGSGISAGLSQTPSIVEKLYKKKEKQEERRGKLTGTASRDIASFAKQYYPALYENKDLLNKSRDLYLDIIESNPNFSEKDKEKAFALAIEKARETQKSQFPEEKSSSFFEREKTGGLFGDLQKYLAPAGEAVRQKPSLLATELPVAGAKFERSLHPDPLAQFLEGPFKKLIGTEKSRPATLENMLASHFRKGLPEELKEGAERVSDIESMALSFLPLPGLKGFSKAANVLGKQGAVSSEKAAANILKQAAEEGIDIAKVASGDVAEINNLNNYASRISSGAPKAAAATEKRIARVEPQEKTFKTAEQQKIRQQQLKQIGKYEAEIEKDAAERALRREKLIPKTERGQLNLQERISFAEKNLPKVREDYYKASSRVRALENQLVKASEADRKMYEDILQIAKKDLTDAEFLLNSTLNNSKTGSARVGLEEMRQAARNKMIDISDKISEGKEIALAKKDYNPEFVKEAKKIASKKPLPGQDSSDYFTQVHAEYGNEYRNQIGRINQEIENLPKDLNGIQRLRQLEKEKNVLNKLIDHVEAENVIHGRKLALRNMAERQKADQRFRKLEIRQEGGKVSKVGQEKIKEQAKMAVKDPAGPEAEVLAQQASVKKSDIGEALGKIKKEAGNIKSKIGSHPLKNLLREGKKFAETWQKEGWYQAFAKTPAGQEVLFALGEVALSDLFGIKSSWFTVVHPRRIGVAFIRKAIVEGYKKAKQEIHVNQYLDAVKKGDEGKRSEISKKYPSAAKEARKKLNS